MKKRIISGTLALVLMLAMLPTTALAADTYTVDMMHAAPTFSTATALKTDGTLWGWGDSLPMGTSNATTSYDAAYQNTPAKLGSGYIATGVNWFLKDDHSLWMWGEDISAHYGKDANTPVKVMDSVLSASGDSDLKGACFVALKTDGTLWGWGEIYCLTGEGGNDVLPTGPILLLKDVAQAQSTGRGWMALKLDGTLWSAGTDFNSNLSGLPIDYTFTDKPLTMVMDKVAAFSLDFMNTMVIKIDGSLWCWGDNGSAQIGNGTLSKYGTWQATPVKIMDDVIYASAGFSSFAITSDGTLYGWGSNESSKLGFTGGNSTSTDGRNASCQTTPKQIATDVAAVSASSGVTAILKKDGSLWTCGYNVAGYTGHSTSTYPENVSVFTKLMDGVALPEGAVSSGTTTAPPTPPAEIPSNTAFSDTAGHWANDYIKKAADSGLVNGVGNNKYEPDRTVSNAEWCQMLVNLIGQSVYEVPRHAWWYPAVNYIFSNGFLAGTEYGGNYTFSEERASDSATRYDMAQMVYHLCNTNHVVMNAVNTSGVSAQIADYQSIPADYRAAVEFCYAAGFITGTDSKGTFNGTDVMTRASAATVLCRLLDVRRTQWHVIDMLTIEPSNQSGYDYTIKINNRHIENKLSNGKDITPENIKEILEEIKVIFPYQAEWSASYHVGTVFEGDCYYYSSTSPASGGGCNAFAGMVFDLLFGRGARYTSSDDLYDVKPGDIIHLRNKATGREHWIAVMSVYEDMRPYYEDGDFINNPRLLAPDTFILHCDGNVSGKVNWDDETLSYLSPNIIDYQGALTNILSYYPDSFLYSAY